MLLNEQWRYEVDLFALKSDFCIICFIHIYIMLYFIMTINVVLFYAKAKIKLMIKKKFPIMLCRFSIDVFALKEMPYFAH